MKSENRNSNILKEKILLKIINDLPNYVFYKDRNLIYRACNKNFVHYSGFQKQAEIAGKSDYDMPWGNTTADIYRQEDNQVIKTRCPILNKEVPMKVIGSKEKILLVSKSPLFDDTESVIGVLGIYIDITEKKQLEKKLIESQEARFKAMSAIAGMMAHELRTPLMTISLALTSWQERLQKIFAGYKVYAKEHNDQTYRKPQLLAMEATLKNAEQAVYDATHTINSVLTNIRYSNENIHLLHEPFSLRKAIQHAMQTYPFEEGEQSLIKINASVDYQILGDINVIVHVLHNLVKNALYAIAEMDKGTITLSLQKHKNTVVIIFEDTAKGISQESLPHIFDPFYTTKKQSAASIGMGLYFCKLALEKMGGTIICDSVVGQYTRFTIHLQAVDVPG